MPDEGGDEERVVEKRRCAVLRGCGKHFEAKGDRFQLQRDIGNGSDDGDQRQGERQRTQPAQDPSMTAGSSDSRGASRLTSRASA